MQKHTLMGLTGFSSISSSGSQTVLPMCPSNEKFAVLQVKGPFLCYFTQQQVSLRCSFQETFYLLLPALQTPSELHKSKRQSCGGQRESPREESSLVRSVLVPVQRLGPHEADHLVYICTTSCHR